jgi:hypothetical protein
VARAGGEFAGGPALDHLAGVEHEEVVADAGSQPQVVGDEQHGGAMVRLERAQEPDDVPLGRYVEGRRRLVGDE